MRKSLIVGLAAFLVLGLIGAPAATAKKKKKKKVPVVQTITFEQEGTIRVAAPSSAASSGVTEAEFTGVNECASMPASQGHDGYVVEIPAEYQDGRATLTVEGSDTTGAHDFNVYFYDASCSLMEPYLDSESANESGPINLGAKWAVIDLFLGANASFKLTGTTTINVVR